MNKSLRHIARRGEGEKIEFKTSFQEEVIISLVAFANTKGGTVYVGIKDNGAIQGVEIGKETYARNKLIAEAFYLTGDIEKYGSGFQRIRSALTNYPTMTIDYKEVGDGFMVSIAYTRQKTSTENVVENVVENEQKVLQLLRENKSLSAKEIGDKLSLAERTIQRYLKQLTEKDIIERVGPAKGGKWILKNDENA